MEEEKFFFEDGEKRELTDLFAELFLVSPTTFEGHSYKTLKRYLLDGVRHGNVHRDAFGMNPIIGALKTSLIAAREIGLKGDAITACLLLPCITSEGALAKTKSDFGDNIFVILHGLMRIGELYKKNPSIQSENFRNLLVSFAEDMRVILIMIANRVALMRDIKDTSNLDAQQTVASEAAYLYAPLAHKLGLYKLKSELEDLSLKYLEHDAYYHIKEKLNATKKARDEYIAKFIEPINKLLLDAGLHFHMKGRTKSIHSIWQKMKKQSCPFEGVYDLFAIRIILDSKKEKEKQDCWQVYSIITDMYQPNPKRLRDWLSIPKSNGYESLHITVLGPDNKWVEVQIRTERMDEVAEHGLAAHWRYKGVRSGETGVEEWLANIRSALENNDDMQLMDQFKTDLYEDEVYVFTPKGDLFKLAKGATVLDFAYHIHTNIGNQCIGAMVNNHNVSIRHKLQSGDQVSILTSSSQKPKSDWLSIVQTSRAKAKIRQALNDVQVKEGVFGKELLERKFKNRKIEWDETTISHLVKKSGYKENSEFFKDIACEKLSVNDVIETYTMLLKREANQVDKLPVKSADEFELNHNENQTSENDDVLVIAENLKGLDFSLAKCCHPIYGDDVFGFVTVSGGIKIHRCSCPNATALRQRFGYRIVKARWAGKGVSNKTGYTIVLSVVGNDDLAIVNNITSIISKEANVSLRAISIDSNDGLFAGTLTIIVSDTKGLETLIKKLKTVKGVKNVERRA